MWRRGTAAAATAAAVVLVAAALAAAPGALASGGGFGGGGGGDGFIRKYAMMKVYESCLGREVVRQVQQELRAACQRCSGETSAPGAAAAPAPAPAAQGDTPAAATDAAAPAPAAAPAAAAPAHSGNKRRKHPQPAVPFDPAKLQEAILGFRQQNPSMPSSVYPPAAPSPAGFFQTPQAQPFYYPGGYFPQQFPSVGYAGGYPAAAPMYPQAAPFYPAGYSNGYSAGSYSSPYTAGSYIPVPATSGLRGSREMDFRSQLESLSTRMGARTRNATCVLQELGYLDENLEPNYAGIQEKLRELPVSEELKRDMLNGVEYCRQFAGCLPQQGPGGNEARRLFRSRFFFQCYKHKKLEACVMKDVREGYDREDAELRSVTTTDPQDLQDIARDMFDFLSGASLAEESIY